MKEQNPHDKFLKQMMTKKETAAAIIKIYFPEDLSRLSTPQTTGTEEFAVGLNWER